ncbi:MAG: urease accessory protein UreD [Roseibium sp.]
MYDAGTALEIGTESVAMQRVRGIGRVRFAVSGGKTRLADLYQSGSAKIRLPKVYNEPTTAVLINSAGGLTGGDQLDYDVGVETGAHAIVTSQAAERAYRSLGTSAKVTAKLSVADGGTLEWLPQETILFDRSNVTRSIQANLTGTARLMILESVLLGRAAMGEQVRNVTFKDTWRIRRDDKLVFADDLRFDGDPNDFLHGNATGCAALAVATLADCTPDAEDRLENARSILDALPASSVRCAASAWNGLLTARFVAKDSRDLRSALMAFLKSYRSADLPRVWHC